MNTWQKIKQNPELINRYLIREQVIDGIRQFFKAGGFHEVETPLLVQNPGTEPYLEVFETRLKDSGGRDYRAFLTTSPELSMKKLMTAGLGNTFQICKSFRNGEGKSSRHNSEFTILEWYRVNCDYTSIMSDCEQLLLSLLYQLKGNKSTQLIYQNTAYDLTPPWTRITVAQAFNKYAGIDTKNLLDEHKLVSTAKKKGYHTTPSTTWEEAYNQIFLNEIETKITKEPHPTIIYDYPASQAALSRKKADDPRFAERFEFFLAGLELGNAFSELNDWQEQEKRMQADLEERRKLGKVEYGIDTDFIDALKEGMTESAGIAVGVDRLVMLFSDVTDITDTLFFPQRELFDLGQT